MITIVLHHEASAAPTAAAKKPTPKKLVSAAVINENNSLVCAAYTQNKKVTVLLSRIDGKKHLGKKTWTSREIKSKLSQVGKTIKTLKGKSGKADKKKLSNAQKQKQELTTAKNAVAACVPGRSGGNVAKVRFAHVEKIIESDCQNCHRSLGWTDDNLSFQELMVSSGRIAPGDLEASPFYTFLSNTPEGYLPGYMPKGRAPLSDVHLWLLKQWIVDMDSSDSSPPPTPSGSEGQGRQEYNSFCASCHGPIDVSAKYGKTAAQISAALGTTPQMLHLRNLSQEQIQRIALALSNVRPPAEGSLAVRNLGSVSEGNLGSTQALQFEVKFSGKSSQPFTVGYVTSNGSALAGSDFNFSSGTMSFEGNDGEVKVITVVVLGDNFQEPDEAMFLDIGGVSHGGVGIANSTASGIILNDDSVTEVEPVQGAQVRLAYGFNGNFQDALGLSDAAAVGNASISANARVGSGALQLDGNGDYITVPGNNLGGMSNISVAAWVFLEANSQTSTRLFDFGSSTSNYLFFSPRDANNRIRFELRGPASATFTLQGPANSALATGQWIHVATVFNSTTDEMKIIVNGTEVATRSGVIVDPATLVFSANQIGRSRVGGSADLQGRVDEVLVWNAPLSAAEVAATMAMTQTTSINSGFQVQLSGGLVLSNNSEVNFGTLETGDDTTSSFIVHNSGPAGVSFTGSPNAQVLGADAADFSVEVQPMPWQQLLQVGSVSSIAVRYSPSAPGTKNATLVISNNDLLSGNFALQLKAQATGQVLAPAQPAPGQGNPALEQGQLEYAVNCASCHGSLGLSQKTNTTVEKVMAAQNPATGVAQMKNLQLSIEQVTRIVLALNTPIRAAADRPVVGDSVITVGTATFVVETLKDVFLPPGDVASYSAPNMAVWTIITEGIFGVRTNGSFIANRVGSFSRRCQRFDTSCQTEQLGNSLRPVPDTIRAGLLKRTCDLLTDNDTAIANALGKIGLTVNSPLTPHSVKDLYEKLFAPGRVLPQYLADVISTFPNQAPNFSNTDKYRAIVNYLCISGVAEVM